MRTTLAAALVAILISASHSSSSAQTLTYVLKAGSSIASTCRRCDEPAIPPQPLTGTFDVTPMPVAGAVGVAAISNLQLQAPGFSVYGNGFLQRQQDHRFALAIEAELKGEHALLVSGKTQFGEGRSMRAVLASRGDQSRRYVLVLSASPVGGAENDADHDGIADTVDNCVTMPNADQRDDDHDNVGNPCDTCSDGSIGMPVTPDGCRYDQLCPCHVTTSGLPWENPGAYLRCIVRSLRVLRRTGQMTRGDAVKVLRQAGRSGCGRPIVASHCRAGAAAPG